MRNCVLGLYEKAVPNDMRFADKLRLANWPDDIWNNIDETKKSSPRLLTIHSSESFMRR